LRFNQKSSLFDASQESKPIAYLFVASHIIFINVALIFVKLKKLQ